MIIVPCSLAALMSGLVQSLGTEWGLLRHDWIVAKLSLTVSASVILLLHIPSVSRMARIAVDTALRAGLHRASLSTLGSRGGRPARAAHHQHGGAPESDHHHRPGPSHHHDHHATAEEPAKAGCPEHTRRLTLITGR